MKNLPVYLSLLALSIQFVACKSDNKIDQQIEALEKSYDASGSRAQADSLLLLYADAVKKHPNDQAANFRYLVRTAGIQFLVREDGPLSVKTASDALTKYGKGQNLTEIAGLFARMWIARDYHKPAASRFKPDEIDLIQAFLLSNQPWIDSSLVRLEKEMMDANGQIINKKKATAFIETSEGYAIAIRPNNPDKYVDLMMRAAGVAKTIGNPNLAIQLYYAVAEKMPDHPKAPTALFMMGFTYENDMSDLDKARSTYESFLQKYPNDPDYADDAQNALKLLGKSPEEIIREFEKNKKDEQNPK